MQRVIIDSDLLSELVKLKNPNVEAKTNAYPLEHTHITFISLTALEILSGLKHCPLCIHPKAGFQLPP